MRIASPQSNWLFTEACMLLPANPSWPPTPLGAECHSWVCSPPALIAAKSANFSKRCVSNPLSSLAKVGAGHRGWAYNILLRDCSGSGWVWELLLLLGIFPYLGNSNRIVRASP